MRKIPAVLTLLALAACATTPEQDSGAKKDATKRSATTASAKNKGAAKDAEFSDERPVPKPTAKEIDEFNRIWELFRKGDARWSIERDRFKRRSDAAAYILAGHVLNYYMQVNAVRDRAGKDLVRAKNEVVAVGEPCVPVLIDLIARETIPMKDGAYFIVDDITRKDCIDMLERIGGPAVPGLLKALKRTDLVPKSRRMLALALGGTRDPRAFEPLVGLLKNDESWMVRADAATALVKLGDRRALGPLGEAVKNDPDPAVVKRAGKARYDLMKDQS